MKRLYKSLVMLSLAAFFLLLSSCSGGDYLNAIPAKSTALISIDLTKTVGGDQALQGKAAVLQSMLYVDDVADCGIDLESKLYLFEAADGNLGLCAKVSDSGKIGDWLSQLATKHIATSTTERKGYHFSVLKNAWLVGYSDNALLIMGPVVAGAQAELQRQMVKYLSADDDNSIVATKMYEKMQSIESPMAMVAQAQALPEKFVAPFTLGAPKGTDASQIIIAAEMKVEKGLLHIDGETLSFNEGIDKAIQSAVQNYRPISGAYLSSMPDDAQAAIFMNVDGSKFLPMMQNNQGIQQLLMGINTAIDMDNIIRSVDGDMAIVIPSFSDSALKMSMSAKLKHSQWLQDVDYWKKSCPQGGKIGDWGKNSYYYTDGKTSFYFGVSDDMQFFSGSDELTAEYSIKPSNHPISKEIQQMVSGQRLAMVVNLSKSGSGNDAVSTVSSLLTPIFGNINSIVYTLK